MQTRTKAGKKACFPALAKAMLYFLSMALLFLSFNLSAVANTPPSDIEVQVTVRSENGEKLGGVSIHVKGVQNSAATDGSGFLKLLVSGNAILEISHVGFEKQEVEVNGRDKIEIILKPSDKNLKEVVVVGYTQTRRDAQTSAITTITAENISKASYASVTEKLQGQVPGLLIASNSGVPGTSVLVRLRGATSVTAGNDPLYVVDGVFINNESLQGISMGGQTPNPLADLNPQDVESVSVLKDANATAVYGARGANGVILITTKRGNRNAKTKVNFNAEYGWAKANNLWELVTGQQHAELVNLVHLNDGLSFDRRPFRPTSQVIAGWPAYGNPEDQQTFDRINDVFRTAQLQRYNLSLSGGDAKTNFYLGTEYQKQEATLKIQDFTRYSFRFNLDHSISNRLKVGTSNSLSSVPRREVRVGDGPAGLFQAALHTPTFYPFYNADGSYAKPTVFDNHLAIIENSNTYSYSLRSINNIYIKWNILPSLSFKSSYSNDYNNYHEVAYYNTNLVSGQPAGQANDVTTTRQTLIAEQLLNYSLSGEKSDLAVFLGNTVQTTKTERQNITGTGFPSDQFERVASAAVQTASTTGSTSGLLSFFAGANYSYDNRYVIDANLRADASSRFGKSNQWGYFPSVGLGWNISNESFFPKTNIIDELRLKASAGLTGNQNIDDFASRGLWAGGRNYGESPGIAPSQLANPDLKWETTRQINVGIAGILLNKRLDFEINIYEKYTTDLLLNEPVPANTGFSSVVRNVGEMSNRGIEFLLNSTNINRRNFLWKTSFAISRNKNKVEKLLTPITGSYEMYRIEEGNPLYSVWAYHEIGLDPQTGNAIYEDGNKDGKITESDRRILGDVWPDFEGSLKNTFNYKNFDLNINVFFKYGNSVYNYTRYFLETVGTRGVTRSIQTSSLNYWKKAGDQNVLPRPTNLPNPDGSYNYFRTGNSRYLEDGSYLRLRDVTIGYTLPAKALSALKISQVRLYASASNLFTITSYTGPDPEVNVAADGTNVQGLDFGTPPQPRVFNLGITLTF